MASITQDMRFRPCLIKCAGRTGCFYVASFRPLCYALEKQINMNDPASCGEGLSFVYLAELCDKEEQHGIYKN